MRFFAQRMKMVVEPTGCLGCGSRAEELVPVKGKRVGVLVSGGNVDLARFAQFIAWARACTQTSGSPFTIRSR